MRSSPGSSPAGPACCPPYDAALLRRELDLFPDWYLARHLGLALAPQQRELLERMFALILASNLAQPAVYVHRDYMPRNLMLSEPNPGILDFQDAVYGPISYDVASLVRDAFISWDEERALDWIVRYWDKARRAGLPVGADFGDFYRDLEWMGLQRHLKVLGIFARLKHRDGKPGYLEDTPRFIALRARGRRALQCARPARASARRDREPTGGAGRTRFHESDDPRRRARREHAPAHRHHAQVAARRGRQAADRLAAGEAGPGRLQRSRDQSRPPRAT